ncbi:MAG TPA: ATP-binding protein [Anaerolineaceae bacterium]
MENNRMQLDLLYNISRELASSLDLHHILQRVIFLSIQYVEAESGSLIALDDHLKPFDASFVYDGKLHSHTVEILQDTLEGGLAGWVVKNRQPALIPSTDQDERWLRRPYDVPKSAICVPLLMQDALVGVLTIVHPKPGFFNQDHLALLQAIADQAGIAVRNALLYQSLQTAHSRYLLLFEDSIDPVIITDSTGKILEANRQASILSCEEGYSLVGGQISDLHEINPEKLGANWANLENGRLLGYESMLRTCKQSQVPIEVYVRKVTFGDENFVQWIFRDLTERKALDSLRKDMTSMIIHDLRAPLSNIVSSLDMISALIPCEQDPTLRSVFAIASRSSERLMRLINSLLDIDHLEAGQAITNRKNSDPAALLQDSFDIVVPILQSRQQELVPVIDAGLSEVWVDQDMTRRVLINLIENASKFSPHEGKITVSAHQEGNWVHIAVADTGPGIPPESKEKIFEKFTRLKTSERSTKGLGIGLAFCKLAVEAHGGKIWVDSQVGSGSTFHMTLPVSPSREEI